MPVEPSRQPAAQPGPCRGRRAAVEDLDRIGYAVGRVPGAESLVGVVDLQPARDHPGQHERVGPVAEADDAVVATDGRADGRFCRVPALHRVGVPAPVSRSSCRRLDCERNAASRHSVPSVLPSFRPSACPPSALPPELIRQLHEEPVAAPLQVGEAQGLVEAHRAAVAQERHRPRGSARSEASRSTRRLFVSPPVAGAPAIRIGPAAPRVHQVAGELGDVLPHHPEEERAGRLVFHLEPGNDGPGKEAAVAARVSRA